MLICAKPTLPSETTFPPATARFSSGDTATAPLQSPLPDTAIALRYATPGDVTALQAMLTHPKTVYWTSELPYAMAEQITQRFVQPAAGHYTLVAT